MRARSQRSYCGNWLECSAREMHTCRFRQTAKLFWFIDCILLFNYRIILFSWKRFSKCIIVSSSEFANIHFFRMKKFLYYTITCVIINFTHTRMLAYAWLKYGWEAVGRCAPSWLLQLVIKVHNGTNVAATWNVLVSDLTWFTLISCTSWACTLSFDPLSWCFEETVVCYIEVM